MRKSKKFIALISLLIVSGFLVTSLASFFVSRSSLRKQITRTQLPLTSVTIYTEIQRDLLRPIFISSLMATDTFLRDWVLRGERDRDAVTRYLKTIKEKYGLFTAFFVSDRTYNYYYFDGILKKVSRESFRDEWYFRTRAMKDEYEINVDIDMAHQDALTIFINYRVLDYQGNFIGATGVGLNLYTLRELIQEYQEKYGCHIFFVNRSGAVTLRGAGHPVDSKRLRDMESISKYEEEILSGDRERFQYRRKGKTRYLNVRYIPEFEWFLLIEQGEEAVVSDILRTLLTNLVILLVITVIVLAIIMRLISTYNRRQEYMATRDELTGALNRHAFDELMPAVMDEYSDRNMGLSALMVDLDFFKTVNDSHGHHAGDLLLKEISNNINSTIREPDLLFRWGGEEFLVLLKNCNHENAVTVAEKIRNAIESQEVMSGDASLTCTASLGVAEYVPGESEDELINRADRNLYRAKEEGRNRVCGG